jgi:hypothetical protein
MEHDGRHELLRPTMMRRPALPHGGIRRGHVTSSPTCEPRVDPHGRFKAGFLSMNSVGIGMSANERVSSWRCSAIGIVKAGRCGRDENSNCRR